MGRIKWNNVFMTPLKLIISHRTGTKEMWCVRKFLSSLINQCWTKKQTWTIKFDWINCKHINMRRTCSGRRAEMILCGFKVGHDLSVLSSLLWFLVNCFLFIVPRWMFDQNHENPLWPDCLHQRLHSFGSFMAVSLFYTFFRSIK